MILAVEKIEFDWTYCAHPEQQEGKEREKNKYTHCDPSGRGNWKWLDTSVHPEQQEVKERENK